jgi:hypothetical protein
MDPVPGHTNNLSHSEINKTSTLVLQDFTLVLVDTYLEPGIIESYQERKKIMQVYSLLGFVDYEGQDLLGVFGSLESLMEFVESERVLRGHDRLRSESLGFDQLGYVVSELGSKVDVLAEVEYL